MDWVGTDLWRCELHEMTESALVDDDGIFMQWMDVDFGTDLPEKLGDDGVGTLVDERGCCHGFWTDGWDLSQISTRYISLTAGGTESVSMSIDSCVTGPTNDVDMLLG